jgi:hypothetical protein
MRVDAIELPQCVILLNRNLASKIKIAEEFRMRNRTLTLTLIMLTAAGFMAGLLVASGMTCVQAQPKNDTAFPAVPGQKGGEDISGPYEPVVDWPKPLTSLAGDENWTWGSVEGIYAESPDRVFIAQRGELPALKRPTNSPIPAFGPSLSFPTGEVPFRNASQGLVASLPDWGKSGAAGWQACLCGVEIVSSDFILTRFFARNKASNYFS